MVNSEFIKLEENFKEGLKRILGFGDVKDVNEYLKNKKENSESPALKKFN